jgi:thiol-disulfide isomerase/thioredoxin
MHKQLMYAMIIALVMMAIVNVVKCRCGCWRWCGCTNCCCNGKEGMATIINLNRVVTLHYTNWCHYCKLMKPVWSQVEAATAGSGIIFKTVDEDVTKTQGINGYPTIRMVTETGELTEYTGTADFATLRNWVVSPIAHRS